MNSIKAHTQDLHIHTRFSYGDSMIVPEQTLELIHAVNHAEIIGIADHLNYVYGEYFEDYRDAVRALPFYLGTEIDGSDWISEALPLDVDYYVYHCPDQTNHYKGIEKLLETGKPLIIPHPLAWGTDLNKVPSECYIEINNRYIWRNDWRKKLTPFLSRFRFVLSSDAHQPFMLNQNVAKYVAKELGIKQTLIFPPKTDF